jgi:hypothetical protein
MQPPQLELWSAEPHPTPPVYLQLTSQQRGEIALHLGQLILRMIQEPPPNPPTITLANEDQQYER